MTDILPSRSSSEHITAAREHVVAQIQHALNAAWQFTGSLPEGLQADAQNALRGVWENAQIMSDQWSETQELLNRSLVLVEGYQLAVSETSRQRDEGIKELKCLVEAIRNRDMNHPVLRNFYGEMYEEVMEQHNANFWESLPYDVADVMGEMWSHMDADTLVQLIQDEELDINAEANDWTLEQIQWARASILKIIRQMRKYQSPDLRE